MITLELVHCLISLDCLRVGTLWKCLHWPYLRICLFFMFAYNNSNWPERQPSSGRNLSSRKHNSVGLNWTTQFAARKPNIATDLKSCSKCWVMKVEQKSGSTRTLFLSLLFILFVLCKGAAKNLFSGGWIHIKLRYNVNASQFSIQF